MSNRDLTAAVNFFLRHKSGTFAFRRLPFVPRVGDKCVFNEVRYQVAIVEWCMDEDATDVGVRVNVELEPVA
ncbi:hypothetical protein [Azohydromonas aeria]|uniref:hypothetical protein n=1 Tax=Azohydromonas aeria TaxID=2590212 RepID=UPI0012F72A95|nr:hypothetical protein [Azohydromonas aeria]